MKQCYTDAMTPQPLRTLFESEDFIVYVPQTPHIDRADGGHVIISPKEQVTSRIELDWKRAQELMKLTIIVGKAMFTVLPKRGIDLGRINYQENGNWNPQLHQHLYGRAHGAMKQHYGNSLHFPKPETGFYDENHPLNEEDCALLSAEINRLVAAFE